MTKRNNKNKKNLPTTPHQHDEQKKIVRDWNEYFGKNINVLSNWQKLCHDVGLGDNFTSKTQCRKALKGIWVNIRDFLDTENKPADVKRFESERALSKYTRENPKKMYPRKRITDGSPLRDLLAHIF